MGFDPHDTSKFRRKQAVRVQTHGPYALFVDGSMQRARIRNLLHQSSACFVCKRKLRNLCGCGPVPPPAAASCCRPRSSLPSCLPLSCMLRCCHHLRAIRGATRSEQSLSLSLCSAPLDKHCDSVSDTTAHRHRGRPASAALYVYKQLAANSLTPSSTALQLTVPHRQARHRRPTARRSSSF